MHFHNLPLLSLAPVHHATASNASVYHTVHSIGLGTTRIPFKLHCLETTTLTIVSIRPSSDLTSLLLLSSMEPMSVTS